MKLLFVFTIMFLCSFTDLEQSPYVMTAEDRNNLHFYKTLYEHNITPTKEAFSIPRSLHWIWLGSEDYPADTQKNIERWMAMHPNWTYHFWTDIDRPLPHPNLQKRLVSDFTFSHLFKYFNLSDNSGEKSEILRYEILFQEGGLYVDLDTYPRSSFENFQENYDFFCGIEKLGRSVLSSSVNPSTHIIGSRAGHPILSEMMKWIEQNWNVIESGYPGISPEAIYSRVKRRTFSALGEGIHVAGFFPGSRAIVFPPSEWESLAAHAHASTWWKKDEVWADKFQTKMDELNAKNQFAVYFLSGCLVLSLLTWIYSPRKALLACVLFLPAFAQGEEFCDLMGKNTPHWSWVKDKRDLEFLSFAQKIFEKNQHLQLEQMQDFKIPKVIHFIWLGPRPFPSGSVENVRMWIANHPDWKVKFWTDKDRPPPCKGMEVLNVNNFPFLQLKDCYEASQNWGEKSDILRFEILLQEGGTYVDHDASCLQSFEGIHKGFHFYCGLETPHTPFVQRSVTCGIGVLGSCPGHPTVKRIIDLIAGHWEKLAKKYPGSDGYSRTQIVIERTYIPLTLALEEGIINLPGYSDMIFPAAYLFSKKGIPSLYSQHFYADSWASGEKVAYKKEFIKSIHRVAKNSKHVFLLSIGAFLLSLIVFVKKMRPLFIFLFLPFLMGCGKKPENAMPRDDFESLMGKNLPAWEHVQTREDWDNLAFFKAVFEKNKSFIEGHAITARIPKVIHFIWMGPRPFPRESVDNVRSWIGKNPDWKVKFWTDRERPLPHPSMEKVMIKDFAFSKLGECFNKSDNYGEKSDILRYEILLREGGVYVDHDVKCVHAFDSLNEMFDLYCGMEVPYKTGLSSCVLPTNNIVGSRPGHPVLKYCLDWLSDNWDQIEQDYPGQDRESVINRVSHRTFLVLGEAFKLLGNRDGNRDIAFPSFYFNAPKEEWALFARHQYAGTWFENESKFEKTTRERLMYLSKKSNKIILLCGIMGIFNVLGFTLLVLLYRRLRVLSAGARK